MAGGDEDNPASGMGAGSPRGRRGPMEVMTDPRAAVAHGFVPVATSRENMPAHVRAFLGG